MKLNKKLEDYTEAEFLEFARKVCNADYATEDEANVAVQDFIRLSEHPDGTDILFYPSSGQDDSPEGIVKQIKEWRAKSGKPGFKK
ncbi:bacteriocin immunity protein [Photorhabdus laumondii subsp. laumondii]|uniref:Photorhabdus luminescens subsp. laumondii TTO1 complete genome segment 7/17 n=5 Tax=Photorhabdus TaxID=29487 RepID=Q7N5Q2_PHOLL|nr:MULTISPECIES: bacteriocin immunity protein [Photorhabdus]KGM29167.1 colicin immunity protein [Photorhabdus luminescens]AWK41698.1 colicin immunity protein [Photorhabdus laumondii subsp. laumondii]AXG42519.1 bacteriocin immunity protein [Photorhabdus laumondii subsp. laumondii]AXG47019.1 bacteriocin immunity protein [Photorhabdus laumondii subsp. laumondii]EYU16924.1 Colicin immunity protein / pyocin immunity protein [Photorhabdus aegyptia]